jgi:hypothetical protein
MLVVTTNPMPEVPADHESDELVERDLGPLIKAAFEWHQTVEKNDGCCERQVESDNGEDPENVLLVAESRCPADPECPYDKDDLRENKIE